MPDPIFDERLAEIYDDLDPDRSDLDAYAAITEEFGARSVLDVGCGTGTFACLLANRGLKVIAVDPAAAMLAVAKRKPGAELVRWIHGVASDVPTLQMDLVTMTGNVAQVFLDDEEWADTLTAVRRVLRAGGRFVFESRRPKRQAWRDWNPTESFQRLEIDGVGVVETWDEVTRVALPFVSFRGTIVFLSDNVHLESESTLRFRSHHELVESLGAAGFQLDETREAPDRLGAEYVFLATLI